jgi:hypothetical protein
MPLARNWLRTLMVTGCCAWLAVAGCSSSTLLPDAGVTDGMEADAANDMDGSVRPPDASLPPADGAVGDGGNAPDGRAATEVDRFATIDRAFREFACPCTFADWEYPSETECIADTIEVECMSTAFADPLTDRDFAHLTCIVDANAAYLECLETLTDCSADGVTPCQDDFADAYLGCPPPEDATFEAFGSCLASG